MSIVLDVNSGFVFVFVFVFVVVVVFVVVDDGDSECSRFVLNFYQESSTLR